MRLAVGITKGYNDLMAEVLIIVITRMSAYMEAVPSQS